MSFCTNCGNLIEDNAKFCTACGTAVASAAIPVAESVSAEVVEPEENIAENVEAPVVEAEATEAVPEAAEIAEEAAESETETVEGSSVPAAVAATENTNNGTASAEYTEEELEYLKNTKTFLEWERKLWIISGILWSVLSFIYLFVFFTGIFFVPMIIISFIAANKTKHYVDIAENDLSSTAERMSSVKMLVFSALFNSYSAVFFIINFVRTKTNADVIQNIIAKQGGSSVI